MLKLSGVKKKNIRFCLFALFLFVGEFFWKIGKNIYFRVGQWGLNSASKNHKMRALKVQERHIIQLMIDLIKSEWRLPWLALWFVLMKQVDVCIFIAAWLIIDLLLAFHAIMQSVCYSILFSHRTVKRLMCCCYCCCCCCRIFPLKKKINKKKICWYWSVSSIKRYIFY